MFYFKYNLNIRHNHSYYLKKINIFLKINSPTHESSMLSNNALLLEQMWQQVNVIRGKTRLNKRFYAVRRKARRKEKDAGTTEDPKLYLEEAALERQLPELDLRMLVDLPPGLDYNEWLASHTLALFDHINLVYGTISEFCTMTGCPDMTGPGLRCVLYFFFFFFFEFIIRNYKNKR